MGPCPRTESDALDDRLLIPHCATGDGIGVLHAVLLLQEQHRHFALRPGLQRDADTLGATAIRQGGADAVNRPGREIATVAKLLRIASLRTRSTVARAASSGIESARSIPVWAP